MDQPRKAETFRDFIDRREDELVEHIHALRSELGPLEKELAEIRKTKATLGIPPPLFTLHPVPNDTLPMSASGGLDQTTLARAVQGDVSPKDMTIKELIIRALLDFPTGAMPEEIGDHISKSLGRSINPGSLRPNLLRLREAGAVTHDGLASRWMLDPNTTAALHALINETPPMKMAIELAWKDNDNEEPAETQTKP